MISELLVPERGVSPEIAAADLQMMVVLTGKERSAAEFEALLTGGGFKLLGIHPTSMPSRVIIEAAPDPMTPARARSRSPLR